MSEEEMTGGMAFVSIKDYFKDPHNHSAEITRNEFYDMLSFVLDNIELFLLHNHALLPTCKCRMCRGWRNFKGELRS